MPHQDKTEHERLLLLKTALSYLRQVNTETVTIILALQGERDRKKLEKGRDHLNKASSRKAAKGHLRSSASNRRANGKAEKARLR